jgi:CheY-like chemotaxis protein
MKTLIIEDDPTSRLLLQELLKRIDKPRRLFLCVS